MFSRILAPGRESGQKDAARKAKIAQTSPKTGLTGLLDISYKTSPKISNQMPRTILIADDYEDNRELLRVLLASAQYEVLEAANGRDCLKIAREQRPDLIMIDLSMPVLDGWGVFRELKSDERTSKIPCVAVTARADTDRERALKSGFTAYLTKPYRTLELLEIVRQLLNQDPEELKKSPRRPGS